MKYIFVAFFIFFVQFGLLWAEIPLEISQKISSENPDEQLDACIMLGRLGTDEAVEALQGLLRNKSMLVRHSAANALARIGGPGVNKIFSKMIATGGSEARRLGLAGLAMTGDPDSIELVISQLDDNDWQVRWAAVYALGEWGCKKALPKLSEMAENDPYFSSATGEYPVRKRAKEMCEKIKSSVEWYQNFDKAVSMSKEQQKPLWIYWRVKDSNWCNRLEEEVFLCPEISDISQNFVCVKLDVFRNADVSVQCEVSGAPYIILLDKDGGELDRILGYIGREELIAKLKSSLEGKGTPKEWKQKVCDDPADVLTAWRLVQWYMDQGRMNDAVLLLNNILQNDPENKKGHTDNAIFTLGYILGAQGKYNEAIPYLNRLCAEYPDYKDMDKALFCLGLDYLSLNNIPKAKEVFVKITEKYPDSSVFKPSKDILGKIGK